MNFNSNNYRIMIPCSCHYGFPACGDCAECQTPACRECSITYNERILTHHDCMTRMILSSGIHIMDLELIFDRSIWDREFNRTINEVIYRPQCKKCHINDAPVNLMIWYNSRGWIHPHCVDDDLIFNNWVAIYSHRYGLEKL